MDDPRDMQQETVDHHEGTEVSTSHIKPQDPVKETNNGSSYQNMSILDRVKAAWNGVDPYTGKKK